MSTKICVPFSFVGNEALAIYSVLYVAMVCPPGKDYTAQPTFSPLSYVTTFLVIEWDQK